MSGDPAVDIFVKVRHPLRLFIQSAESRTLCLLAFSPFYHYDCNTNISGTGLHHVLSLSLYEKVLLFIQILENRLQNRAVHGCTPSLSCFSLTGNFRSQAEGGKRFEISDQNEWLLYGSTSSAQHYAPPASSFSCQEVEEAGGSLSRHAI